MKTLIIAGTFKHVPYEKIEEGLTSYGSNVHYDVALFGQSPEQPLMECIGFIDQELRGFDHLQDVARARYCKWFNTDLFDIVSMETLKQAKVH